MTDRRRIVRSEHGDLAVSIDEGGHVQAGEVALTGTAAGDGAWHMVDADGRAHLVHVARFHDGWWAHVDGAVFRLEASAGTDTRPRRPSHDDDLAAPMPASVLAIVAPEGTRVGAGDVVLLLEAMKMELPIRAPRDGVVSAVRCRVGELVQPGIPLVDIS